jgi:hypothetical protein
VTCGDRTAGGAAAVLQAFVDELAGAAAVIRRNPL